MHYDEVTPLLPTWPEIEPGPSKVAVQRANENPFDHRRHSNYTARNIK